MASLDALSNLPMAWLYRLSTTLTAESAARLRSTCKLLQQVIDSTWEPVEVEVPPHRRSVPLTFEQVQAQLPPQQPRSDDSSSEEDDPWDEDFCYDRYERPDQDGCNPYWQEIFGPALTRLTANQALNLLKGKPVLSFLWSWCSDIRKGSSSAFKMDVGVRSELVFRDYRLVGWPPKNPSTAESKGVGGTEGGSVGGHETNTASEHGSDDSWLPGRGRCGWNGYHECEEIFFVTCNIPAVLLQKWGQKQEPYVVGLTTGYSSLLVTTNSSCREATEEEVEQFLASNSPQDGDRFDVYLSSSHCSGPVDIYVFLAPVEPRFTGRPKAGAVHHRCQHE